MAARYLVTAAPGVPVPGLGLVKRGEDFTAPPGFQPGISLRPLNTEAVEQLAPAFAQAEAELKRRMADVFGSADREAVLGRLQDVERARVLAQAPMTDEEVGAWRAAMHR